MEQFQFRYADEKDTALILQFIKDLAEYEHMLDEVVATEELLNEWIFQKEKAEVIFALEDDKEVIKWIKDYYDNYSDEYRDYPVKKKNSKIYKF